jgi:hypothetical protein
MSSIKLLQDHNWRGRLALRHMAGGCGRWAGEHDAWGGYPVEPNAGRLADRMNVLSVPARLWNIPGTNLNCWQRRRLGLRRRHRRVAIDIDILPGTCDGRIFRPERASRR